MGGARENAVACMRYELCISRKRLLHSVFTRNASEREDVGEGVAAHVVCAVDAARDLARGVEAGDDAAVSVEHFGPRGDGNAAERAVDAHGDLGAVEGASGDAVHEDGGPATDGVVPCFDGLVVGIDGRDEGFGGDLKQGGEFGDGVRLEGVAALVFATPDADEDGLAKPHLSDIAGETVTVVKGDEVDTTFLLQNELSSRRLAPVKVRVASDGGTPSEIIRRAVERGDKLFAVSTDLLRETSSDLFSGFVKVDMRVDDETGLVSSVTPMPGRVFAAGLSVARMGLLEFAATLFALDIAPDIHWVRPADYRSVHLAAERMRDPVYMSYQKKTLLEEMREHAAWVILAAAILIGMIWHSVAAERLVRRRSAELMETVKRQQASERQFEALERMTAVSQMSNIVAHELRQPLAAVTNFAMGVRRRIANGTLTADSLEFALGRILAENERASDIVEHVRDYARKRRRQITPVDLTQMSAKVVSSMRASNARVSFESEVPAGLFVEGDSLEIELVLRNLVKNAGESAAQADGVPRVVLAGERIGDEVVITVTDNGPVRTKAEIDAFLVPLRSEKSGGLGLGLAIVRRIIEAYGGTIVFDVVEPQGVRVEARLPARPDL